MHVLFGDLHKLLFKSGVRRKNPFYVIPSAGASTIANFLMGTPCKIAFAVCVATVFIFGGNLFI